MAFQQKAIKGFGWSSLAKIISTGMVVIKVAVIARLLTPTDIGLFSLTTIALGLMESFTETGINLTILQARESIKYFLDTAWVIAIIRGFMIGILMIIAGGLMQWYYSEPSLLMLVGVAAFVPVIKGFINPAIVSLHKEMKFFADSTYRVSLVAVETVLAIGLTIFTGSVFALIWAMILTAIFEVGVTFILIKYRPAFNFIPSRAKTIFGNAKGLTVSAALNYLNENLDNILIGKFLGTNLLGQYHNGYSIGHKSYDLTRSVNHSTLPAFVKLTNDIPRLRRAFLKTCAATMIGLTLLSLPLLFFPTLVVNIVLGSQWGAVIPVLPLLTLAGLVQSFHLLTQTLFYSVKKYWVVNSSLALSVVSLVIGIIVLSPTWGLSGAVLAVFVSRLIPLPVQVYGLYNVLYQR